MEIEYHRETGKYSFLHDGKYWEFNELKSHFRKNGHVRETVGFGVPSEVWQECRNMAIEVEAIFREKEERLKKRRRQEL